jgi:hypothetical protein
MAVAVEEVTATEIYKIGHLWDHFKKKKKKNSIFGPFIGKAF